MSLACKHGNRTLRNGTGSNGRPWSAAFCPTPKGTADQCEAVWLDENGQPKAPSAKAQTAQVSHEQTAIFREMNNTLAMIFAWLKLQRPTPPPHNGSYGGAVNVPYTPPQYVAPTVAAPVVVPPSAPNPYHVSGAATGSGIAPAAPQPAWAKYNQPAEAPMPVAAQFAPPPPYPGEEIKVEDIPF